MTVKNRFFTFFKPLALAAALSAAFNVQSAGADNWLRVLIGIDIGTERQAKN